MSYGPIVIRKTDTGLEIDYTGSLEYVPERIQLNGHNVKPGEVGHESVTVTVLDRPHGEGWSRITTVQAMGSTHRDRR